MARYLMNVINGADQSSPVELEAPDFQSLKRETLRTACLMMNENYTQFWDCGEWQMIVTDGSGLILFTLHMNATVAPVAVQHFSPKVAGL